MSLDVDVTCSCNKCGGSISEHEETYCEACYTGESTGRTSSSEDDESRCGGCGQYFLRSRMLEKLPGLRCRKCAAKYEEEILAKKAS